jgi:hypothetical protein
MPGLSIIPGKDFGAQVRGAFAAALVAIVCLAGSCAAQGQDVSATEVKAAYLYKFAPFVNWPAGAFNGYAGPFTICVVGPDPFGAVLDKVVAGQTVGGKPIVVRRLAKADKDTVCQVLFADGTPAQVKDALQAVDGQPVLTVTDGSSPGGVVDFMTDGGTVHFRLDDDAAAQKNLVISSKLLSLATAVKRRPVESGPK